MPTHNIFFTNVKLKCKNTLFYIGDYNNRRGIVLIKVSTIKVILDGEYKNDKPNYYTIRSMNGDILSLCKPGICMKDIIYQFIEHHNYTHKRHP